MNNKLIKFESINEQRLEGIVGGKKNNWFNDFIKGFNSKHRFW